MGPGHSPELIQEPAESQNCSQPFGKVPPRISRASWLWTAVDHSSGPKGSVTGGLRQPELGRTSVLGSQGDKNMHRERAQGGAHTEQDLCLCLLVSALDSAGLQTQTPETMAWQQDICCDMPTNVTGRGNSGIMGLLDILHHDEVFIFLLLICILQLVMEP